jgi:hypothetical protein
MPFYETGSSSLPRSDAYSWQLGIAKRDDRHWTRIACTIVAVQLADPSPEPIGGRQTGRRETSSFAT